MRLQSPLRKKPMKYLYASGLADILFKGDYNKKAKIGLLEGANNEGYIERNDKLNNYSGLDKY